MRLELYALTSVALAGAVVTSVFRADRYFYVACTHLTTNTMYLMVFPSVLATANSQILMNLLLVSGLYIAKFCKNIFFGPLRPLEVEVCRGFIRVSNATESV
jgi:hypothetical protein